jgi:ABC-type multidrug transport system fused ATPase/permease subunit
MKVPFMQKKEILQSYQQNIDATSASIGKLKKTKRFFAVARLITMATGVLVLWYFWPSARIVFPVVLLFAILFIYLVFRDADTSEAIKSSERLLRINQHEIDSLQKKLEGYEDGYGFTEPVHPYASDLDLFGPFSIFQWLNRCHADQSKKLLADFLKNPLDAPTIQKKQEAVKEMAKKQMASQQFQSMAMANPLTDKTEKRIRQWMNLPAGDYEKPIWTWTKNVYPLLSLTIVVLYSLDYISTGYFIFWLIGFVAFSSFISAKINSVYELLSRIQPEMDSVHAQLQIIEKESFESAFLVLLQKRLKPPAYDSAAAAMHEFHTILKKFDFRLNFFVFMILNGLFLWDLRQLHSLNEWKNKNRQHFGDWFEVIAEMEVVISLASVAYNEPDWCFPTVDEDYFHFNAEQMGHPLIDFETRVNNDFSLKGCGQVALITGSNMAGKSTFLRSLGINTVLGLMGAPACARRMSLSQVKLISSMRVADNLAESTSTFYAELKKLKFIIDSVNRREPVFILLDEVLRGTNSTDRHKGSRALVRQLLGSTAVTVMATHDTELAHSESRTADAVANYHFEGKVIEDELYFDYKIKKGICESLNATSLMKKIGIQFQD